MVATTSGTKVEELAHHLLDVVIRFCQAVPRARKRLGELKDIEFLTLSLLHHREPLIVGDIQRHLGVLPAQMSRIIRALENRERPLIACRINPQDKRKIDVVLTPAGRLAFQDHQAYRVRIIAGILSRLPDEEFDDAHRLLSKISQALDTQPVANG
jgi:DNA-binding MarR family transcriptional regulator